MMSLFPSAGLLKKRNKKSVFIYNIYKYVYN